jgi:muramoyltetrapeptide carboxypeptidase
MVPSLLRGAQGPDDSTAIPRPERILPKALRPGSTIGVAFPASGASAHDMREFAALCSRLGMNVKYGQNVSRNMGYLSASDADRIEEFMGLVKDPEVDAIVCGRGGYGVMRILPMLDYAAIRAAAKPIMGFSDITALLVAIERHAGLVTFHGPVASSSFDAFTVESIQKVLMRPDEGTAPHVDYSFKNESLTILGTGVATGRLVGGNLAMIVSTLGTNYEIDTQGAILFLEEISEEPYRIDRMLTQLWLAGKLDACAGFALGSFRDCETRGGIPRTPSVTLMQVLQGRIGSLGKPAVYGMPFGHVKSKLTIPIGVTAELDVTNRSFRLLEGAVA